MELDEPSGEGKPQTRALLQLDDSEPVPTVPGRWADFYSGMRDCLGDGAQPPVSGDDAVRGLAVIDAARASARDRRVVAVDGPATA